MFNSKSKEFSWANVQVVFLGRVVTRLRGVKYTVKKEKEYVYANGENPFAIQSGNKTYEGEVMILQSEIEALQADLARDQDLTDIPPFSITVAYVPLSTGELVTHQLNGVEFTEDNREFKQADKFQELTLPIMFLERKSI